MMKKIIFGLLSLFLVTGTISAQTGKKALKEGAKAIEKFAGNLDDGDRLAKGLDLLEVAFQDETVSGNAESFLKIGEAYNKLAEAQVKMKLLKPEYEMAMPDASSRAFEAFQKVMAMTDDKGDVKDALKGIANSELNLNNTGIILFDKKDYGGAFDYYNAAINAYKALNGAGHKSRLDDEAVKTEHYFITAASGYYGEKGAMAKPIFKELFDMNSDKPLVYEALYNIATKEGNDDEAGTYLAKGRELFPDDTGLLFAEINYYLKKGNLEVLLDKLETAREKEPDNNSIVVTLGNVYDQLSQKSREAGDTAKADEYFDKAFGYYEEALANDPNNFDAAYSQGALYYNKAAGLTDAINKLSEDYSTEGTKKYNALKETMNGYFDKALPYFLNAEKINGNDMNVLIALKEIYARKNMLDKSKTYKDRIDQLGN